MPSFNRQLEIGNIVQTGVLGFEPRQSAPEALVLPLHYTPNDRLNYKSATQRVKLHLEAARSAFHRQQPHEFLVKRRTSLRHIYKKIFAARVIFLLRKCSG